MQDAASIFLEQSVKALRSEIDPLWAHPFLLFSLIFSSPDEQHTCFFLYKHIKFSDEARLCLSYHKIKTGVMLTVCLLQ